MSDYLQATSYIHAGKDWSFDASNHLSDVKIIEPPGDFYHLVYSLPKKYLQSNASTFCEWQKNEEGSQYSQARRITFCWFLDLVNRMCTSYKDVKADECGESERQKKENPGDGTIVFFETIVSSSNMVVGDRIHVFIHRKTVNLKKIMRHMLKEADKKIDKKMKEWDYHQRHVKTMEEYVLNVVNIYRENTEASQYIYDRNTLEEIYNPLQVFSLNNFTIEGGCNEQNTMSKYFSDGKYKFPRMKLVRKRFWHQIKPSYLWKKYLPSYQHSWVDLPEIHYKSDGMGKYELYVKPCPAICRIEYLLPSSTSNTYRDIDQYTLDEISKNVKGHFSMFEVKSSEEFNITSLNNHHLLSATKIYADELKINNGNESKEFSERLKAKYQNQHSISSFDIVEMEMAYRSDISSSKDEIRKVIVEKFKQLCMSGDSDISAAGKCIANWVKHVRPELDKKFGKFNFELMDHSLSPFANMQFWFSQALDTYMCVATAHSELIKLHYAVYDAYRQHGENQLHWNMIYTGEGATSKSFVFEQKQRMSIPGTISEISYQTTRADAIDGDQNDHITVFNEAPPGLFQAKSRGEDAQKALSAMKEKLTSNRVRTKEFVRDEETGERKNRIAISSQIGCYVGATNDNPADAEEAVATRFHWGEFEKVFRKDKSISDYQRKAFEMQSKPELMKMHDRFLYYCQDQQMKVFYVWKFIFCGIIRDVDLDAADVVFRQVSNFLKKNHTIRIPPRTVERYRIMCRILTITNALDMVFNIRGSKHQGKDFEVEQLLDVENLLYCTEEIAICAMNMVSVEIPQLAGSRKKTIHSIWKIFKSNMEYKKDKTSIGGDQIDYNYIRLKGYRNQIVRRIQNMIPFKQGKPSLHNIEGVLQTLRDQEFRARSYNMDNPSKFGDDYPQPMGRESDKAALLDGNNFIDIHIGLFDNIRNNTDRSIMVECVKNLPHSKTRTRRIVTGVPKRNGEGVVEYPQFMEVVKFESNRNKMPPIVENSNQETNGVKQMMRLENSTLGSYRKTSMNMDTDIWGWHKRCSYLNLTQTQMVDCHPDCIPLEYNNICMTFPDDLKENENEEQTTITANELISESLNTLIRAKKRRKV